MTALPAAYARLSTSVITQRIAPGLRAPSNSRGTRQNQCIFSNPILGRSEVIWVVTSSTFVRPHPSSKIHEQGVARPVPTQRAKVRDLGIRRPELIDQRLPGAPGANSKRQRGDEGRMCAAATPVKADIVQPERLWRIAAQPHLERLRGRERQLDAKRAVLQKASQAARLQHRRALDVERRDERVQLGFTLIVAKRVS